MHVIFDALWTDGAMRRSRALSRGREGFRSERHAGVPTPSQFGPGDRRLGVHHREEKPIT